MHEISVWLHPSSSQLLLFYDCAGCPCAGSLEKKQAEAERLRGEKQKMAERLQFIESKILQSETEGGECLMDQAKSREARIQEHQQELERRFASTKP
jgi:hypothetical protein